MSEVHLEKRTPAERCPYCHDQLAGEVVDMIVECRGCGTEHHAVCLSELGRCTVLGCEKPEARELPEVLPRTGPVVRAIRARMRSRVRAFVRRNVSAPSELDLERMRRTKELEEQVGKWTPEILLEALRDPTPHDTDLLRAIKKVADRRGLIPVGSLRRQLLARELRRRTSSRTPP